MEGWRKGRGQRERADISESSSGGFGPEVNKKVTAGPGDKTVQEAGCCVQVGSRAGKILEGWLGERLVRRNWGCSLLQELRSPRTVVDNGNPQLTNCF